MLKRLISVLLVNFMMLAIPVGAEPLEAEEPVSVVKEFEQTKDLQRSLEDLNSKYLDRFIVKTKEGQMLSTDKISGSFSTAKKMKLQTFNQLQEEQPEAFESLFSEASDKNPSSLSAGVRALLNSTGSMVLSGDDGINQLEISDQVQVIELSEKIDPEIFIENVGMDLDGKIEYIQPDYQLELAANKEEALSLEVVPIGPGNGSLAPETEIGPMPSKTPQSTEEPMTTALPEITSSPNSSVSDKPENPNENENQDTSPRSTPTPENVVVAVIDTGIDVTHPDLAEHVVDGYNFANDSDQVYDPDLGIEQAHGTHVAGIIAQTAPDAKIMPLKCFENGRAYTSDLIEAINFAKENGASIVNCSWGSKDNNQALREAMEQSGLFFVCAAGNNRMDVDETPIYPASFGLDNSISVTSLNQDYGFSYYSNYGMSIDIAAIGREVESAFPGEERGVMNGSSMSAGFVSGAAALAKAVGETDLKTRIISTGDRLSNLQDKLKDGRALNLDHLLTNTQSDEILDCTPADDFDVSGYERTPEENWELFGTSRTMDISAGNSHVLALKENGTVWAWGGNSVGQLGDGTNTSSSIPVQVIGLNNITSVSAGDYYSMALKSDGTVYSWGSNSYYCLGLNISGDINIPQKINVLSDIKYIHASDDYQSISTAINNKGQLYAWGYNEFGNITDKTYDWSGTLPTRVTRVSEKIKKAESNYYIYVLTESNKVLNLGVTFNADDDMKWQNIGINVTLTMNDVKDFTDDLFLKTDGTLVWRDKNIYFENSTVIDIDSINSRYIALDNAGVIYTDKGNTTEVPVPISVETGRDNYYALTGAGDIWYASTDIDNPVWNKLGEDFNLNQTNKIIVSGANHTIKINEDGSVSAWGNNVYGQLGDGTNNNSDKPVTVSGLQNIVEVAAGENFSLALDSAGNVYAWGSGTGGMLGSGSQSNSNTPIKIEGLSNIIKVSSNNHHSLALDIDGNVYAWGLNSNGQLGVGDKINRLTPTKLTDAPKFTDISAGATHSLAVDTSGNVWGWGNNNNYKIGHNDAGEYLTPRQGKARGMKAVFAGNSHSAAISSGGEVYTWGNNREGQLGVTEILQSTSMPQNTGLSNIVTVSTKQDSTFAIDSNGTVYSWGVNTYGQLGRKSNAGSVLPEAIEGTYTDIAAGSIVTHGLDGDGNLYIWGAVNNRQPTNYFEKVPNLNRIKDISARGESAAIVDSAGQVYTWGNGRVGNLGHGTDESEYYPRKVEGVSNASKVAKGYATTYALDKSGQIWGWGQGAFAIGGTVYSPMQAPNSVRGFKDIAARNYELYALRTDGTVWSHYGAVQVQGISNVSQLECGDDFTVALSGNTVYTWGNNDKGQLGDGTNVSRETPQAIQGSYTKIFTSSRHVLAIGTDGNLYAWGWNSINQLGLNDPNKVDRNVPTKIDSIQNVKYIGTGYANSMATLADGTVWAWGEGRSYQFGNGNNQSSWTPIKNTYAQDFTMVSGGSSFNIAINKSGELYTSGANNEGQRGLYSFSPVKVVNQVEAGWASKEIGVTAGELYTVVLSAKNIRDFNGLNFTFEYDASAFELIDAVSQTYGNNTAAGQILGSDITITDISNGSISFETRKEIPTGKVFSGYINGVTLKAKQTGQASVSLSY